MQEVKTKYHSDYRIYRYEQVEEPKKQCKKVLIGKKLAIKVIMDCRTTSVHEFRTWLGFQQFDVTLTRTISANKNNQFIWRRKYANTI